MSDENTEERKKGSFWGAYTAALLLGIGGIGTSSIALLNGADHRAAEEAMAAAKDPVLQGLLDDIGACMTRSALLEGRIIGLEKLVYTDPGVRRRATDEIRVELPPLKSHEAVTELNRKLGMQVEAAPPPPVASVALPPESSPVPYAEVQLQSVAPAVHAPQMPASAKMRKSFTD